MIRKKICGLLLAVLVVLLVSCFLAREPIVYERLYIDTFHPEGPPGGTTNTQIWLYNSQGIELAVNDNGILFAVLDYTQETQSGIYYIKVAEGSGGGGVGYYDIRVQALKLADTPAGTVPSGVTGADGNEPDDSPEPWNSGTAVPINLDQVVPRALVASDVDWFRLVLP